MRTERFGGDIKNGRLTIRGAMRKIKATWQDGDRVIVTVEDATASKTGKQRAYYFGPVLDGILAGYRHAGYDCTKPQVRAEVEMLSPHNKREGIEAGATIQIGISGLTKDEMSAHVDFCIRLCAESFDIEIEDSQVYLNRLYGQPA